MAKRLVMIDSHGMMLHECVVADSQLVYSLTRGWIFVTRLKDSKKSRLNCGGFRLEARYGGTHGNSISFQCLIGETGQGHEYRPLSIEMRGLTVTVVFGTDAVGASVSPTTSDVAQLINSDPDVSDVVVAKRTFHEVMNESEMPCYLSGGKDNGEWVQSPVDRRIQGMLNGVILT